MCDAENLLTCESPKYHFHKGICLDPTLLTKCEEGVNCAKCTSDPYWCETCQTNFEL